MMDFIINNPVVVSEHCQMVLLEYTANSTIIIMSSAASDK